MRFAIVENGSVTNVIEAEDNFLPSAGVLVPDADGRAILGGSWDGTDFMSPPAPAIDDEEQRRRRARAFAAEADPLFFKIGRGEATNEEWLAKVAEIRARFPYGEEQL